jgi:membrane protease subunit HflK
LQDLYSTVPKVLLDVDSGNNIMYLPLDGLLSGSGTAPSTSRSVPPPPLINSQGAGTAVIQLDARPYRP